MQILTSIRNVLQSLACGILLPVLFAACGSTGKGPAADSTATATLPVRSNDEVVAHACRILDTATRQMETATDVATLADLASDAMGDVARCSHYDEAKLFKLFGVNAELIIDRAWGWEPSLSEIRFRSAAF